MITIVHDIILYYMTGFALKYAGKGLKADHRVVLAAVRNSASILEHAPAAVRANKDLI